MNSSVGSDGGCVVEGSSARDFGWPWWFCSSWRTDGDLLYGVDNVWENEGELAYDLATILDGKWGHERFDRRFGRVTSA